MTKSVSYCSLEEAWGDNYVDSKEASPEEVKPNKDVSYSGGKQFSTELLPQTQKNEYEDSRQTNIPPDYENNKEKYAIVPYNMDREQLWGEFLEYVNRKNKEQRENKPTEGFASIGDFGSSINPAVNKKDNSYVDLLILIMFGIIVIFILDSFVRFGRKSKRD